MQIPKESVCREQLGREQSRPNFFIRWRRGEIHFGPYETNDWKLTVSSLGADEYSVYDNHNGKLIKQHKEKSIYSRD